MKKIVSLLVIAAMMISTVLTVSAAEVTEAQKNSVYEAYIQNSWVAYVAFMEDAMQQFPEHADSIEASIGTFEAYRSAFMPMDELYAFDSYGVYGEEEISFWRISDGLYGVWDFKQIGDYCISIKNVDTKGYYAYVDGKLLNLFEAYADGIVTDAHLEEMYHSHLADGVMWRYGDVNNDKALDVADIMGVKDLIVKDLLYAASAYGDFDRNGAVDVGDIMSLKDHIMAQ